MLTLQKLQIIRLESNINGIFAYAKYPNWYYEYNFLIENNGKVKGKTSLGSWEELSLEASSFIQEKVHSRLVKGL
jgi:hypothetical protein